MSKSIGTRRLIGIWGVSGTGKTQTLRALAAEWVRQFRFDRSAELVKGIDVSEVAHTRAQVLDYVSDVDDDEEFSIAYQPDPDMEEEEEADECGFLARLALAAENCVLTVDEGARSLRNDIVHPSSIRLALEGRKRSVSMIVASQRPIHVHPSIRGEAYGSEVFLYRVARADDLRDMANELRSPEMADAVGKLEDLHGFYVKSGSGGKKIRRVTVVPHERNPQVVYGDVIHGA